MITPTDGGLIQECGAGLIRLDVTVDAAGDQQIAFELPKPKITPLDDAQINRLESSLGSPIMREFVPCLVDVGARWVVAQLPSAQAVLENLPALEPMKADNLQIEATGVIIFGEYKDEGGFNVEVRAYAPACGVNEDPVCGSGNGAMAAFIRHTGQTQYFGETVHASQGQILGRAGIIHLSIQDHAIKVGGQAVTCIDGKIILT